MAVARMESGSTSTAVNATLLYGWQIRETAGAAARVTIRRNSNGGAELVDISLSANESVGEDYAHPLSVSADFPVTQGDKFFVNLDSGAADWYLRVG